jgi:hypothetical protein
MRRGRNCQSDGFANAASLDFLYPLRLSIMRLLDHKGAVKQFLRRYTCGIHGASGNLDEKRVRTLSRLSRRHGVGNCGRRHVACGVGKMEKPGDGESLRNVFDRLIATLAESASGRVVKWHFGLYYYADRSIWIPLGSLPAHVVFAQWVDGTTRTSDRKESASG